MDVANPTRAAWEMLCTPDESRRINEALYLFVSSGATGAELDALINATLKHDAGAALGYLDGMRQAQLESRRPVGASPNGRKRWWNRSR